MRIRPRLTRVVLTAAGALALAAVVTGCMPGATPGALPTSSPTPTPFDCHPVVDETAVPGGAGAQGDTDRVIAALRKGEDLPAAFRESFGKSVLQFDAADGVAGLLVSSALDSCAGLPDSVRIQIPEIVRLIVDSGSAGLLPDAATDTTTGGTTGSYLPTAQPGLPVPPPLTAGGPTALPTPPTLNSGPMLPTLGPAPQPGAAGQNPLAQRYSSNNRSRPS